MIIRGDLIKNKVEEYRKKFNYTQSDLGKMLNVSRQTIISIENEKYNPSILLAHNIAKLFNTSIEEIFIFESEE